MSNDFLGEGEGGKDDIQAKIAADALQKVDQKRKESESYFALVPDGYKTRVAHMVEDNFPTYKEHFGYDVGKFREAMARNWLAKREAFNNMAELAGMKKVSSMREVHANPNDVKIAILTASSSYLLVGTEAFDRRGPGASFEYTRIPLREGERDHDQKIESVKVELGGIFAHEPRMDEQAKILDMNDNRNSRRTSRVMSMFVMEDQTRPNLDSHSLSESFIDVDAQTITSFKLGDGK